jgi:biotin carboxylase
MSDPVRQPGEGRVLCIVDDGVPEESVRLLCEAAGARGVATEVVHPLSLDGACEPGLREGDLLFNPAVSAQAARAEQLLWHPGVATFHLDASGPLFGCTSPVQAFALAGLPVPRTFWPATADRARLREMAAALGGLPVVLKLPGYSRGVGVVRCDSFPALLSTLELLLAQGQRPQLSAYVPGAVHHRLVVVGEQVVAHYRNRQDEDDFRTSGSEDPADYHAPAPPGAAALAVAACKALRLAHAGVDVLAHESGRLYLLEANFPCYFAQAQLVGGADVAGAMLDWLLARAESLAPAAKVPVLER